MNVTEIVEAKIPFNDLPGEILLAMYIEEVGQSIKTYCNRSDIPSELAFTHANMVVDLINGEKRRTELDGNSSVSSIKEGDVTVQFGSARVDSRERATEQLLFDYSKQLNRFRKLRW